MAADDSSSTPKKSTGDAAHEAAIRPRRAPGDGRLTVSALPRRIACATAPGKAMVSSLKAVSRPA